MLTAVLPSTLCAIVLLIAVRYVLERRRRTQLLPPGPDSLAQAIAIRPQAPQWVVLDALKDRYGPIYSFFRGSTPNVVVSKAQIAWDLLQKRGEIYSSRPRLILAHEIVSGGMRGLTMPYGKQWRTWRKILNTGVSGRASLAYREHQALESALVLRDFLQSPEVYEQHLIRFAASVVMSISYGRRMDSLDNEVFKRHEQSVMDYQKATIPGNPVETYQFLLALPRALQWFRHDADEAYARAKSLVMELFEHVRKRVETGTAKECMATRSLKEPTAVGFTDLELAFALSAPFGAGIDTTSAVIKVGLCALLHNPAAARKVQDELDRVVGRTRLPNFEDEPALPFLSAFIKEIHRWGPIVPLGMAHSVIADDEYEGYLIPKGSTIIPNVYAMMKDPEMFPDAEAFRPERFLESSDPRMVDFTLPFGFGRRQCVGMHVAQQSVYIVLARLLWAYDIEPLKDHAGNAVLPNMMDDWVALGITRTLMLFKFTVSPRFPEAVGIIEREAAEAERLLKAWL